VQERKRSGLGTRWLELHETRAILRVFNQQPAVVPSFPGTGVFLSHAKQHRLVLLLKHQMCRWETALVAN
jgi:hypothetical protein